MHLHLFFRQWSFHICDTKTFRKYTRTVQVFNIFVEVHRTFHVTHLLIISQSEHRFQRYIYILILHTTTIITCIALFGFRIIRNHYLTIVIHILIGFLTGLLSAFLIIFLILVLCYIFVRHTVLLVDLRLHDFKFILLRTLLISNLSASFRTLIISGQEVRILIDNSCVILYSSAIITRLRTKQTTIKDSHHIIRLHLDNKVEVFDSPVIISYLCT